MGVLDFSRWFVVEADLWRRICEDSHYFARKPSWKTMGVLNLSLESEIRWVFSICHWHLSFGFEIGLPNLPAG